MVFFSVFEVFFMNIVIIFTFLWIHIWAFSNLFELWTINYNNNVKYVWQLFHKRNKMEIKILNHSVFILIPISYKQKGSPIYQIFGSQRNSTFIVLKIANLVSWKGYYAICKLHSTINKSKYEHFLFQILELSILTWLNNVSLNYIL